MNSATAINTSAAKIVRGNLRRHSIEKMMASNRDEEEKVKVPLSPPPEDEEMVDFSVYEEEELPVPAPPDGGWGWVVVFASFMCNLIVDGIAYSFGVFFMEFDTYFAAGKSKTSWVGSLLNGCYMSVGPIVSALTNKFGCRPVTIAGSILASAALILSQFSANINELMLIYGVCGGIGFGVVYLPAIVSVGYYFEKKRAFATGIAVCGSGLGTFLFAPFSQLLLDTYGWKGANLILGALVLNCVIFGALMRPLEAPPQYCLSKPLLQRMAEEKKLQMERGSICGGSQYFMVQLPDGSMERRPKMPLNLEPGVHSSLNLDQFGRGPDTPVTPLPTIAEGKVPEPHRASIDVTSKPLLPPAVMAVAGRETIPSGVRVPNGIPKNQSLPVLEGMIRRNVIRTANGQLMKMSQSNQTMDGDPRKHSLQLKLSSSGMLSNFPSRNNNCSVEEVWVKVNGSQVGSTLTVTDRHDRATKQHCEKKEFARPMYRKDIFYSGSIRNLPEYTNSQRDMATYRASVMSIPKSTVTVQQSHTSEAAFSYQVVDPDERQLVCWCLALPRSMTDTVATMLDFSILRNPIFFLIGISNVFGMLGFFIPFMYIKDFAIMKGVDPDNAAFLLSVIGMTNMVGRLFFGWLTDRPTVDSLTVNNLCMAVSGVCIFATPFANSYSTMVIACGCFGLFISAYISLTSIILVDLLGLEKLTNAFGLLLLFRGGASVIGPPLAGAMFDATGSYDLSFYVAGGLIVFAAFLSFMIPCVQPCLNKRQRPKFSIDMDGCDDVISNHANETNL